MLWFHEGMQLGGWARLEEAVKCYTYFRDSVASGRHQKQSIYTKTLY